MESLQLVKSEQFGSIRCDIYARGSEFWMTREQIGTALEYTDPGDAVRKIHDRHKGRLEHLSVSDRLSGTDGKLYNTYLYSARGIYEICRWSQQPKADAFMDWVWNILEGLRTGRLTIQNTSLNDYMSMSEEDRAIVYFQNRKQLKELEPKAQMFDKFMTAENTQTMAVVAKSLGTGRDRLFQTLRDRNILMANNTPYQRYIDRGYFTVIEKTITIGDRQINKPQTLVTPKGVEYLAKLIKESA